jgi:hypothetical protein
MVKQRTAAFQPTTGFTGIKEFLLFMVKYG